MGNPYLEEQEELTNAALEDTGGYTPTDLEGRDLTDVLDKVHLPTEEEVKDALDQNASTDRTDEELPDAQATIEATKTAMGGASVDAGGVKVKDPYDKIRQQALDSLVNAKYTPTDTNAAYDQKIRQALYAAGTRSKLPDSFFSPVDQNKDPLAKAKFEMDRAKAMSALMGKDKAAAKPGEDVTALKQRLLTEYPEEIKKMGGPQVLEGATRQSLIGLNGDLRMKDVTRQSMEYRKHESERLDKEQDSTGVVDELVQKKDPLVASLSASEIEHLKALPKSHVMGLLVNDRANRAQDIAKVEREDKRTDKEKVGASKIVGPDMLAVYNDADALQSSFGKYGDKMPGIGNIEGRITNPSLLKTAEALGSATGATAGKPEEAVENQQRVKRLALYLEKALGGARMVGNAQMQDVAQRAHGLVTSRDPASLNTALKLIQEHKDLLLKYAQQQYPRAAPTIQQMSGTSSPSPNQAPPVPTTTDVKEPSGQIAPLSSAPSKPKSIKVKDAMWDLQPDGSYSVRQ